MESSVDPFASVGSYGLSQEAIDRCEPIGDCGWLNHATGSFWLRDAAVWFQDTGSGKRVGAVTILVKDGETWAVDRESGHKFKVAVHATPVATKGTAAKLCGLSVGRTVNECTGHPHPEAVLTCVDHRDACACVVVVFYGWDDAEALIGVTRPQGDLANPNRTTV